MSDNKTIRVNIRLDPEDHRLLRALAQSEKLSQTEVLRRGMRELAKRQGLFKPRAVSAAAS